MHFHFPLSIISKWEKVKEYYCQAYFEVLDVTCTRVFAAQLKTGSDNQGISFTRIWNNYCWKPFERKQFVHLSLTLWLNVTNQIWMYMLLRCNFRFLLLISPWKVRIQVKYQRYLKVPKKYILCSKDTFIWNLYYYEAHPCDASLEKDRSMLYLRVKTYLQPTMKQTCLNHLMILHVHKEKTDSLNLHDISNEHVRCSENRLSVFGHF